MPPEPRYLEEPRGRFAGHAAAVLRPASTEAVAAAVAICAAARVGIVPYSGGTGLVGGQIFGEGPLPVILSFERMSRIRDLDLTDGVLTAEAGCVLADVQAAAREAGRLFPLTLASEGSARIGGLLATNAGGVNVLRYGNARDLCLGVEAVMADGSVLHGLSRVVKDNMGYDLRHLLIGVGGDARADHRGEPAGSIPRPAETATAWVAVASPEAALALFHALRQALGGTISAFELMQRAGARVPGRGAAAGSRCRRRWRRRLAGAGRERRRRRRRRRGRGSRRRWRRRWRPGLVDDVLVAQSEAQRAVFWGVRESIPEANRLIGAISSHDISLPPSRLAEFVALGGAGGGGARPGASDQLLRAPRRRQPALQRLPAARAAAGSFTIRCASR